MNSRRQFCADACHAAILAGAFGPLAACGGGGSSSPNPTNSAAALPRITGTLAGNTVTITIDSASPLATVGRAVLVQAGSTQLLVARTGPTAFSALTAICTHEACTVTGFEDSRYVCPCHGSTYDTSGRVLVGPAPSPLRAFATSFSGAVLVVSL
jgi:Rieske Fe-S protein